MDITRCLIEIVTAFFGSLGFGLLFNLHGRKLLWASVGGFLSWGLFLALGLFMESEPLRYFIVSVLTTGYAEALARLLKTPACTFCIVSLVPLVPGGALYYSTTYALSGNMDLFSAKATYTLELAVALSLGIVLVTAVTRLLTHCERSRTSR